MNTHKLTVMTVLALLAAVPRLVTSEESQATARGTPSTRLGITAVSEVHRLLERVRDSLGGDVLRGARSLSIEGERKLDAGPSELLTYRILMPDKYRWTRDEYTFLLNGEMFRREPPGGSSTMALARKNALLSFCEVCLTVLLRAPETCPMRASLQASTDTATDVLEFLGPEGFRRVLEIDKKTARLKAFKEVGTISRAEGHSLVERTVLVDQYSQVGKVWVPTRMIESIGNARSVLTFKTVLLNKGVAPDDFVAR
jgi:hypothetical protein